MDDIVQSVMRIAAKHRESSRVVAGTVAQNRSTLHPDNIPIILFVDGAAIERGFELDQLANFAEDILAMSNEFANQITEITPQFRSTEREIGRGAAYEWMFLCGAYFAAIKDQELLESTY